MAQLDSRLQPNGKSEYHHEVSEPKYYLKSPIFVDGRNVQSFVVVNNEEGHVQSENAFYDKNYEIERYELQDHKFARETFKQSKAKEEGFPDEEKVPKDDAKVNYRLQRGRYPHQHLHKTCVYVSVCSFEACVHIKEAGVTCNSNVEAHEDEEPGKFGSKGARR